MVKGFFLEDQLDILSSPTTLNVSWEWQFRDLFSDHCELGSLTRHFALVSGIDAPPALHPESSGRVEVTAHARILHENVSVGRYSLSRGTTDSDNGL